MTGGPSPGPPTTPSWVTWWRWTSPPTARPTCCRRTRWWSSRRTAPRTLLSDPRRAVTTSTSYVDEADPGPRPAASGPLPTLTGLTVLDDGTVLLLATDSVLALDPDGTLQTLVSPRTSGTDPATRLYRAAVRDGGSGSYLASALPYGDGALVHDQGAGRLLLVDREGELRRLAGRPANRIGGPQDAAAALDPLDGRADLDEVPLGVGGTLGRAVRMALLDDGQLLLSSPRQGVLRLGLPGR